MTSLQGHGVDWFAGQIGMTPSWVYSNIRSIQHNKIGNRLRFTESDVAAFWESRRRLPSGVVVEKAPANVSGALVTSKRARALKKGAAK